MADDAAFDLPAGDAAYGAQAGILFHPCPPSGGGQSCIGHCPMLSAMPRILLIGLRQRMSIKAADRPTTRSRDPCPDNLLNPKLQRHQYHAAVSIPASAAVRTAAVGGITAQPEGHAGEFSFNRRPRAFSVTTFKTAMRLSRWRFARPVIAGSSLPVELAGWYQHPSGCSAHRAGWQLTTGRFMNRDLKLGPPQPADLGIGRHETAAPAAIGSFAEPVPGTDMVRTQRRPVPALRLKKLPGLRRRTILHALRITGDQRFWGSAGGIQQDRSQTPMFILFPGFSQQTQPITFGYNRRLLTAACHRSAVAMEIRIPTGQLLRLIPAEQRRLSPASGLQSAKTRISSVALPSAI